MNRQLEMAQAYEREKALARNGDTNTRRELAARHDVRPEILYYLVDDSDAGVRGQLAKNHKTPRHADLLLARDADGDVRAQLARKIGRLVPGLPDDAKDKMRDLTLEVLAMLVEDRLPYVRRMLAEELQATAHAPPEVIRKLAQDSEAEVAAPVLEFSPLLNDADLLAIVASHPAEIAMAAISRREAVSAPLADALVGTDSVPAIAALLANPSAQIREATLDRIVTRAPQIHAWHEPLARRVGLPPATLHKLTGFLAASLLQMLQNRGDLDPQTATAVAAALHDRLQADATAAPQEDPRQSATQDVRNLQKKGQLDEKAVAAAVSEGKFFFVTEALAALGNMPVKMVERILGTRNAEAVAALSWKASLGARLASRIQTRLAHIPPTQALNVATDAYPMGEAAMDLQLASFRSDTDPSGTEIEVETNGDAHAKGPVDPDWATQGPTQAKKVAEPDWARDETPLDTAEDEEQEEAQA